MRWNGTWRTETTRPVSAGLVPSLPPALAEPFARDLFSRHTFYAEIPERYTVAPLDVPDTDAVLITEEGGFGQDVLLCRGTVVFYLRYYGDQDLSAHPELLAELAQFDGR